MRNHKKTLAAALVTVAVMAGVGCAAKEKKVAPTTTLKKIEGITPTQQAPSETIIIGTLIELGAQGTDPVKFAAALDSAPGWAYITESIPTGKTELVDAILSTGNMVVQTSRGSYCVYLGAPGGVAASVAEGDCTNPDAKILATDTTTTDISSTDSEGN